MQVRSGPQDSGQQLMHSLCCRPAGHRSAAGNRIMSGTFLQLHQQLQERTALRNVPPPVVQRVVGVGAGPGELTEHLADHIGAGTRPSGGNRGVCEHTEPVFSTSRAIGTRGNSENDLSSSSRTKTVTDYCGEDSSRTRTGTGLSFQTQDSDLRGFRFF